MGEHVTYSHDSCTPPPLLHLPFTPLQFSHCSVGFVAAMGGEFLGAFVGAVLVWLHFLPHFKTVPEPPAIDDDDMLLRSRDALTPSALGIASYNTREDDVAARQRGVWDLSRALEDLRYYLKDTHRDVESLETHATLMATALGPEATRPSGKSMENFLRRRSVQVCDVHRRLKDVDLDQFQVMMLGSNRPAPLGSASLVPERAAANGTETTPAPPPAGKPMQHAYSEGNMQKASEAVRVDMPPPSAAVEQENVAMALRKRRLDRLYDAAVVADQNAKLSIFATRPAIFSPVFNFLCEFMCTTALVYGALMMSARQDQLYGPERSLFRSEEGLAIGFFVFVCILGLGGPTGIAANPARDFSPRVAHWLLPIPGKGPTEFYYSWVPFFAPFVGGCAAAGLYAATQLLNHSDVPGTEVFPTTGA